MAALIHFLTQEIGALKKCLKQFLLVFLGNSDAIITDRKVDSNVVGRVFHLILREYNLNVALLS